jgi:hypothetical protein
MHALHLPDQHLTLANLLLATLKPQTKKITLRLGASLETHAAGTNW